MVRSHIPAAIALAALIGLASPGHAQTPAASTAPAETVLALADEEQFEAGAPANWKLPAGWTPVAMGDGHGLRITAAQAGLQSAIRPEGEFGDVTVSGQFLFIDSDSTSQLFIRASAAGSYAAQLDAAGVVTLEKRGPDGAVLSTWRAQAEPQTEPSTARTLQLSALAGALRVTVDGIDVLTAHDAAPLPPGSNKIGAAFSTASGALGFDHYAVWVPTVSPSSKPAPSATPTRATRAPRFQPDNDDFTQRYLTISARYFHSGNTTEATTEANEPVPATSPDTTKTVWYQFTPPTSQSYVISTAGSSFDTVLTVYTGTWPALTEVASSDNISQSLQAQLTLPLDSNTAYYIQLGGRQGGGSFEFRIATPADLTVPSTPEISATATGAPSTPIADNGSTNLQQPVLAWAPRPAITPYAYLVELSTDPAFSSLTGSRVITDPTRFWVLDPLATPSVPAGQKYYWRVSALNFFGQTSAASPAYSFTYDTSPPAPPALYLPAVNAAVPTIRPTLTWQPITDAVGYRATIATNFSTGTPYQNQIVDVTTPRYTASIDIPQGEYWFAVESRDAAGNLSGKGEKRRFVVNLAQTPANHSVLATKAGTSTADVTFTWTKIPGATYTLQVALDSSFTVTTDYPNLSAATHTVTGHPIGTFYWRVNVNGAELPMSLAYRFTVTPPVPVAPLLQKTGALSGALADKAFTNNQIPTLDWTVPPNWLTPPVGSFLARYEVQLATDRAFSQVVGTTQVYYGGGNSLESNVTWPSPLSPGTYYWRVRAVTNIDVAGAFSPIYSFTIDTQPQAVPVITTPIQNGLTGLRPVIKWKAVPGAVRYHVIIASNFSGTTVVQGNNVFVKGTSYTAPADLPLGTYWAFVESQDAAGNLSGITPGGGRYFNVNVAQFPARGTVFVAKRPTNTANVLLKWLPIPGATHRLEVALDGDTSFTGNVLVRELTGTTYTLQNLPPSPYPYYWRVYPAGTTPPAGYFTTFAVAPAPLKGPLLQTDGAEPGALVQDDVTTNPLPVFDWTLPPVLIEGGIYGYQLQLATDSAFTQLLLENIPVSNATNYTWTGAPLTPGTYYWRVRQVSPWGFNYPYSEVFRFTVVPPDVTIPVLTKPITNAVWTTSRPTLQWRGVAQSTGYRVRITSDANGNNLILGGEVTKTTFTPSSDLPQGEYWFCVESKNAQGAWSGFGEKRRFVVNYAKAPIADAVIVAKAPAYTTKVTLKWNKLVTPNPVNTYRIEVDTDPNFVSPVRSSILPVSASSYTFTNQPVGAYYWRITVNGHPSVIPSSRYRITPPLPAAPVIENALPLLTNDATPRFDWKVPANWTTPPPGTSISYQLQLATDKQFTQLVEDTVEIGPVQPEDTHYDWPTDLIPGTTYYWRVRAVTNLGVPGAFSKISSFTVDLIAPLQPVLKAPAESAVSTSSRPVFSWIAGHQDSVLYRLEIYSDPLFATPPVYTATTSKLTHVPTLSLPQGTYYWRVYGFDQAGNGGDQPVAARTITIDYRLTPADGTLIASPTPAGVPVVFKWLAPSGVTAGTTYTIEIDTNLDDTGEITLPPVTALTTTSAALPPGYYQYRLIASNGYGTTDWRAFIIVPQ